MLYFHLKLVLQIAVLCHRMIETTLQLESHCSVYEEEGDSCKFSVPRFSTRKRNWTQSDLWFSMKILSQRFKINEKGGQLDRKLRENLYKML